ncbi:MAG: hypothetical protein CM1200mP41_20990 [Gammaproteobacteria bacterium]|nr:MAG: hypothetical protein CM1200mP41_20990 [Gammaproteobacteria bacterium]
MAQKSPFMHQALLHGSDPDGGYTIALGGRTRIPYDITPDSFRYLREFASLAWMSRKSLRLRLSDRFTKEKRYASRWAAEKSNGVRR